MANTSVKKDKLSPVAWMLLFFLVCIYARPYEYLTFLEPLSLTKVTMILALLLMLIDRRKKGFIFKEPTSKWLIVLQFLTVILIPLGVWPGNSLSFWLETFIKIFAAYIMVFYVASVSRDHFRLIMKVIFLSCTFVGIMSIQAYLRGQYIFVGETKRVIGVTTLSSADPNDLALALTMAIPMGIYLMLLKRNLLRRMFYLGCIGVLVMAILNTGSRGGYLGLVTCLIFFFGYMYRKQKIKFIGIMLLLFFISILVVPQTYRARFMSIYTEEDYNTTNERGGRKFIWKRGLQTAKKTPLGVGIKNYSFTEGRRQSETGVGTAWQVSHNAYLQVAVELGWLGFLAYMMMLYSGFANIFKTTKMAEKNSDQEAQMASSVFVGALMGFMVSSFFLSQAFYWNHYIFLALVAGLKYNMFQKAKIS